MVHVPAKFRENTSMRFSVTVRKLNVTDRRTDGRGALQYLPSRAFGAAGDKTIFNQTDKIVGRGPWSRDITAEACGHVI